jgi:hypothetical protein
MHGNTAECRHKQPLAVISPGSPSEQLGDLDDWHATALLLSEAGQHWALAEKIARCLQMRDGLLRKWSSNPTYRKNGKFAGPNQ